MKRFIMIFAVFTSFLFVWAENKPISFIADSMSGSAGKKNEHTILSGNASVTVGSLTIKGDEIELSGTDFRLLKAFGNVSGKDSEQDFSFSADTLTYDRETEVALFQGSAKLIDTKNSVEATAGLINYNKKTEVAILQTQVQLKRTNIECTSLFALYRRALSTLDLTGNPVVVRDGDKFIADKISVNLDTDFIRLEGTVSGTLKDKESKEVKKE